ncbi:recombination regulator RecX [Leuconostoc carnosum]|uniref:recombination regulator RecX n=1 Tax=Leuconostoc carnosum TaxID=1252 RepID=UPI00345C9FAD
MKTITKISTQKQAGRYSIELDKQFAFGVAESVLIKYGLAKGRELDDQLIERIKYDDNIAKARNTALNYLGHALRTVKQVRQKLTEKEIEDRIQDEVIVQLTDLGYLDDMNYALHYVSTKKNISPKGPVVVKRDLLQAGVSEEIVTTALATYTMEEQLALAEKMALKFSHTYHHDATRNKQQKILQALANKGFSFDVGQEVLLQIDTVNDDALELENSTRQAEKLWRRYQKENLSQRQYKTKNGLYAKGYTSELIDRVVSTLVTGED